MTNADLTAASLLELLKDDSNYLENSEDFEKVQEGSWDQDYKYQYCTEVYKHKASGRFFALRELPHRLVLRRTGRDRG